MVENESGGRGKGGGAPSLRPYFSGKDAATPSHSCRNLAPDPFEVQTHPRDRFSVCAPQKPTRWLGGRGGGGDDGCSRLLRSLLLCGSS